MKYNMSQTRQVGAAAVEVVRIHGGCRKWEELHGKANSGMQSDR